MEDRRKDDSSILVAIAKIQSDLSHIKEKIDRSVSQFDEHVDTSHTFRDKVTRLENTKDSLDGHIVQDRWAFSIMFTMQIAILTKMIGAW